MARQVRTERSGAEPHRAERVPHVGSARARTQPGHAPVAPTPALLRSLRPGARHTRPTAARGGGAEAGSGLGSGCKARARGGACGPASARAAASWGTLAPPHADPHPLACVHSLARPPAHSLDPHPHRACPSAALRPSGFGKRPKLRNCWFAGESGARALPAPATRPTAPRDPPWLGPPTFPTRSGPGTRGGAGRRGATAGAGRAQSHRKGRLATLPGGDSGRREPTAAFGDAPRR